MGVLEIGPRIALAQWCRVCIVYIILFVFVDWIMEEILLRNHFHM